MSKILIHELQSENELVNLESVKGGPAILSPIFLDRRGNPI